MDIDINITNARSATDQLLSLANQLRNIRSSIQSLRSSVDPRVLENANIGVRLRNAENNISSLENDMLHLYRTTMQNINGYVKNEAQTNLRILQLPDRLKNNP